MLANTTEYDNYVTHTQTYICVCILSQSRDAGLPSCVEQITKNFVHNIEHCINSLHSFITYLHYYFLIHFLSLLPTHEDMTQGPSLCEWPRFLANHCVFKSLAQL